MLVHREERQYRLMTHANGNLVLGLELEAGVFTTDEAMVLMSVTRTGGGGGGGLGCLRG